MRTAQFARIAAGVAIAVGMSLGFSYREARADDPNTVWLWKDALGKCPAACDGNVHVCPCRTADIE